MGGTPIVVLQRPKKTAKMAVVDVTVTTRQDPQKRRRSPTQGRPRNYRVLLVVFECADGHKLASPLFLTPTTASTTTVVFRCAPNAQWYHGRVLLNALHSWSYAEILTQSFGRLAPVLKSPHRGTAKKYVSQLIGGQPELMNATLTWMAEMIGVQLEGIVFMAEKNDREGFLLFASPDEAEYFELYYSRSVMFDLGCLWWAADASQTQFLCHYAPGHKCKQNALVKTHMESSRRVLQQQGWGVASEMPARPLLVESCRRDK